MTPVRTMLAALWRLPLALLVSALFLSGLATASEAATTPPSPEVTVKVEPATPLREPGCFDWKRAFAGYYPNWAYSAESCTVFGAASTPTNPHRVYYSWTRPAGSNSRLCVGARGYLWSSTEQRVVKRYYSLGCGTSGSGSVPWYGAPYTFNGVKRYYGVAGNKRVRAYTQPGFLGGAYNWK